MQCIRIKNTTTLEKLWVKMVKILLFRERPHGRRELDRQYTRIHTGPDHCLQSGKAMIEPQGDVNTALRRIGITVNTGEQRKNQR